MGKNVREWGELKENKKKLNSKEKSYKGIITVYSPHKSLS